MQPPQSADSRESSISVAVRVRPFTEAESQRLISEPDNNIFNIDGSLSSGSQFTRTNKHPRGLRKILNVVDDRMLLFDQDKTNLLNSMANTALANSNRNHGRVNNRIREHRFIFDRLFDEDATQEEVYAATTKPLLDSILDGFNATVFAYGATGCGKTHTITGTTDSPGIIFCTMKELFQKIDEKHDTHTVELTLSYLEIYNETIHDLLEKDNNDKTLVIQEDQNKRITVSNLSTYKPQTVEEVMELIMAGNANRTVSHTEANATSSRSHAVLQINVDTKPRSANLTEQHSYATLSIIDLAGSERASSTKNTGERLHEGANINRSLLALGNCINALCDPKRRNHVPYRDSKLTRLLKFSLGGNCKTVMIVCVSPSSAHYDETLNTLKYANRAKEIKTKVIRNQHNLSRHVGSYLKMITEQKQEIEELRNRENKVVEQYLSKQSLQRERNQKMMLESLDELTKSISKYSNLQMNKAYVLAKRKIIAILKKDVEDFLNSFDSVFTIEEDADLIEYDSILPGFSSLLSKAEALSTKFMIQIDELEKNYSKETELDHIINTSSKSISRKLSELENWTSFDQLNFESHVNKMKDTVERNILYQSSVFFDQSISKLTLFKFPFHSLLFLLKSCLENDSVKIETLKKVMDEIISRFDNLLNNDINLNISESFIPSLPASPKKKGFKRSISPLHKSPIKIFKPRSPVRLPKQPKKVRWEIPSAETSVMMSEDQEYKDQTMGDTDQDDDTPLHEKLQRGMSISPSRSKNTQFLKSLKAGTTTGTSQSLTSRKLISPSPPSQPIFQLKSGMNKSEDGNSQVNFIGSLGLGPPQRLQLPQNPSSEPEHNSSPQRMLTSYLPKRQYDSPLKENSFMPSSEVSDEFNDKNNKENNEPVPSVFGDISSIF